MAQAPQRSTIHVILADDDNDNWMLFTDALEDSNLATRLTTVANGEQLMKLLNSQPDLPDFLFLDLNMPRKNGFECLAEIRNNERLKQLPVIIYSSSFEPEIVDLLYTKGAQYYICKPNSYQLLVKVIFLAITLLSNSVFSQPPKDEFVLSPETCAEPSGDRNKV